MKKYKIRCDNFNEDIAFTGQQVAESTNWEHYGDNQNRYTTYKLYETETKKYVFVNEYTSHWMGESNQTKVIIFESKDDIKEHFSGQELANWEKDFLDDAEIHFIMEV